MAVVDQKIEDHLADCARTRQAIFERLGKIDGFLQKIGFMVIGLLITSTVGLAVELYREKTAQLDHADTVAQVRSLGR